MMFRHSREFQYQSHRTQVSAMMMSRDKRLDGLDPDYSLIIPYSVTAYTSLGLTAVISNTSHTGLRPVR
jgi:hypothetical protein